LQDLRDIVASSPWTPHKKAVRFIHAVRCCVVSGYGIENTEEDVVDPAGDVTPIVPVVAPLGTVTTNCVVEAAVTVADVPFNVTVFELGVGLNAVP
jgi:hypothetical protein